MSGFAQSGGASGGLTGLQAISQLVGGFGERRQFNRAADRERKLGAINRLEIERTIPAAEAAIVAAAPGLGIDPSAGSAVDVQGSVAVEIELEAIRAQFGFDARAALLKEAGTRALVTSIQKSLGTILGGAQETLGGPDRTPPDDSQPTAKRTVTKRSPARGGSIIPARPRPLR